MHKVQKTTTKGIVYQDGNIFMIKDERGYWELPGGRIAFGEQPKEALKREFLEELRVRDVEIGDIFHTWAFTSKVRNTEYHFVLMFFICHADLSKIKISDEHQEYKWIDIKKVNHHHMRSGYKEAIKKFLEYRKR